jgi:hypothetical protein
MASKLKVAVAVWRNRRDNHSYAFPLTDPWGGRAYPVIDDGDWVFECVLPPGTSVTDVRPDQGNRVFAKVAGRQMYTADSAIE